MLLLLPENKKCPKCDHLIPKGIYAPLIRERKRFIHCNQCANRLALDHEKRRSFIFFSMLCSVVAFVLVPEESFIHGFVIAFFAIIGGCDAFLPFRTSGMFPLIEHHEDKDNIFW